MRALPDHLSPALRSLAQALNGADVAWRLGGSAMLAAMGLPVVVGDLDVTVPADSLDAVRTACHPWVREVLVGHPPPPWCSDWLVTLEVAGVAVDVIGGFCVQVPAGRVAVPQDLGGTLDLDGMSVPLADPAVWWWVYHTYKPAKAALLAQVVPAGEQAAVQRRLGSA